MKLSLDRPAASETLEALRELIVSWAAQYHINNGSDSGMNPYLTTKVRDEIKERKWAPVSANTVHAFARRVRTIKSEPGFKEYWRLVEAGIKEKREAPAAAHLVNSSKSLQPRSKRLPADLTRRVNRAEKVEPGTHIKEQFFKYIPPAERRPPPRQFKIGSDSEPKRG